MEDCKDIRNMLKPRRNFAASEGLRRRIAVTIDSSTGKRKQLPWIWGVGAAGVASVLILLIMPIGMSAKEVLADVINTLMNAEGIEMTVEVRTRPIENFRYIDLSEDFVVHNIAIAKSDSLFSWRIDKGGRTAIGNNELMYNWLDRLKIGWKTDNSEPEDLLGDMAVLLSPEKILEVELQNYVNNPGSHYNVEKKDGEIFLTVHSQAHGNFANPYMLNASISESENIRRYVIDADTRQLKSATVSIVDNKHETEVLRIISITYGKPIHNIFYPPSEIRFVNLIPQGLAGLSATEAATVFLNAFGTWNVDVLEKAIDADILTTMYREDYQGAVVVSVGHSFTSGNEGNTYVPYILLMRDGSTRRHNLVLARAGSGWIVVGGL